MSDASPAESISPDIKTSADALAEQTDIRQIPRPPEFVLRSLIEPRLRRLTGSLNFPDIVNSVVAPHWNQAVELLGQAGAGYLALARMLDRLQARVSAAAQATEPYEGSIAVADRVMSALDLEAERFGWDTLVSDSMATAQVSAAKRMWEWEDDAEGKAYLIGIQDRYTDPFWTQYGVSERGLRSVVPNETWGDAIERVSRMSADTNEQLAPLARVHSIYKFRCDIVEQVLLEYEALGHVDVLVPGSATSRPVAPIDLNRFKAEQLLLVVVAFEIAQNNGKPSRTAILSGRKGKVGGVDEYVLTLKEERPEEMKDLNWSPDAKGGKGKARYLARQPPTRLFWEGNDTVDDDDTVWEGDRTKIEYFRAALQRLHGELRDAGISTVDDVIAIATTRGSWGR